MGLFIIQSSVFVLLMALCAWFDLKAMIVPDTLTYCGMISGIIFILMGERYLYTYFFLGGILGLVITLGLAILGQKVLKKEALGGGDIKLSVVIGLYTGYAGLLAVFFLSALTAILTTLFVYRDWKHAVPYAFYLSLAALPVYFFLHYLI